MPSDQDINQLLCELGFCDPGARDAARAALVAAGLSRAGKARISLDKVPRVRELLDGTFARACSSEACRSALRRAKPGATLLGVIDASHCENCGGSDNLKALRRLADACRQKGLRRLVVVGGSPSVRAELLALKPKEWELRLIDGTERRTLDKARADLEWAELVFIWGGSELDHRVSKLYTDTHSPHRRKVVMLAKRGIAALLNAGVEHVEKGRP